MSAILLPCPELRGLIMGCSHSGAQGSMLKMLLWKANPCVIIRRLTSVISSFVNFIFELVDCNTHLLFHEVKMFNWSS